MATITKTFKAPINQDNGDTHHFIGHADCRMTLFASTLFGQIKWFYKFIDGKHRGIEEVRTIDLWFDRNHRLIDFSGVHELPVEAIELLEDNGYNTEYAKT